MKENRCYNIFPDFQTYGPVLMGFVFFVVCFQEAVLAEGKQLKYSTYLATQFTDDDSVTIDTDIFGNAYIAGYGSTSGMPRVQGGYGTPEYYFHQSFIHKYSPSNELLYTSYLQDVEITAIAIDASGHAYLTGTHIGTGNSPYCENWGTFVMRLSSDGSSIDYCTQFSPDFNLPAPADITLDSAGNSYVVGTINSYFGSLIPVTSGVFQPSPAGEDNIYVIKISADGSTILSAFFLGGSGDEIGESIRIASDGTIIVSGDSKSIDFPSTTAHAGGYDTFIAKISADGSSLEYSELFGGSGQDRSLSMAIDNNDNIYIGGETSSEDYPTTSGSFQAAFGGEIDSLVFKLSRNNTIEYASYLGGGGVTNILSIDVEPDGKLHFTGVSGDPEFPVTTNAFQYNYPLTIRNSYFGTLSADGSTLHYSTFLGSNIPFVGLADGAMSGAFSLAYRGAGEVLIVGRTNSRDFPVTIDARQSSLRGRSDYFLSIFADSPLMISSPLLINNTVVNQYYEYAFQAAGGVSPYEWFIQPKYLPIGMSLDVNGVLSGTPTGLIDQSKVYTYFLPENTHFLPIIVGVRDQDGNLAYKEVLSQYTFSSPSPSPSPSPLPSTPPTTPSDPVPDPSGESTSSGGGGGFSIYMLVWLLSLAMIVPAYKSAKTDQK
ncbi:MAG: SBBP repeat-containing protein [Candidatus Thiodiazotropha sp.]